MDPEGYASLSARGIAFAIERLLGLDGQTPPAPGLYLPETLVDSPRLLDGLREFGVSVRVDERLTQPV